MRSSPICTAINRIETPRLILRPHGLEDFEACHAMWADPAVVRHISGVPSTREQSWARLLRYAGHWDLLGYGFWGVEERESGAFIGEVGFADFHRDIEPSLDGLPEVGWVFASHAHGKGYATEAMLAALSWGEAHFGASTQFACIIAPENAASIRVAEKCGFTLAHRTQYHNEPALLFKR